MEHARDLRDARLMGPGPEGPRAALLASRQAAWPGHGQAMARFVGQSIFQFCSCVQSDSDELVSLAGVSWFS